MRASPINRVLNWAVNGIVLTADEDAIIKFLIPLYDRNALAFDKLDAWLRKNTKAQ